MLDTLASALRGFVDKSIVLSCLNPRRTESTGSGSMREERERMRREMEAEGILPRQRQVNHLRLNEAITQQQDNFRVDGLPTKVGGCIMLDQIPEAGNSDESLWENGLVAWDAGEVLARWACEAPEMGPPYATAVEV